MLVLKSMVEDIECKTLNDHQSDAEKMDGVLSAETDHMVIGNIVDKADIPLHAPVGLDALPCSIAMARPAARLGLDAGGSPPSKRNRNFDNTMAWSCKPSSRMVAVYREVRRPLPWFTRNPNNSVKKTTRVVHPPPVLPKVRTGVSQAALKYKATDRIKKLAKHRSVPKTYSFDERLCFSVKPQALTYKPSPRIQQLAMPRIYHHREVKN